MIIRISHHRSKCTGCYACVIVSGDRFRMSRKDGKSILLDAKEKKGIYTVAIGEHEYEENKKAELICPAKIIKVNKYMKEVK